MLSSSILRTEPCDAGPGLGPAADPVGRLAVPAGCVGHQQEGGHRPGAAIASLEPRVGERLGLVFLPRPLPEFMNFKLLGKTLLVIHIQFELFLGRPLSK